MAVLWVTADKEQLTITLIRPFMRLPGNTTWGIYQNLYYEPECYHFQLHRKKEAAYSYVELFNLWVFNIANNSKFKDAFGWVGNRFVLVFWLWRRTAFLCVGGEMTWVYFIGGLNKFKQKQKSSLLLNNRASLFRSASITALLGQKDLIYTVWGWGSWWPTQSQREGSVHNKCVIHETSNL